MFTILLPCIFFLLSGWWGPYSGSSPIFLGADGRVITYATAFPFICNICRLCKFIISTLYICKPSHSTILSFHLISITTHHYVYPLISFHMELKFKTFLHCVNNMDTDCLVNSSICVVYMFPFLCYFCYVQFNSLSANGR